MTSQYKYFLIIERINSIIKQKCIRKFYMPSPSLNTRNIEKTNNTTTPICVFSCTLYKYQMQTKVKNKLTNGITSLNF